MIERTIFDETQRWKYLRVPLSGLLLHKRADSLDIRISYWAGTVRSHALSQTHAAAAGAAGLEVFGGTNAPYIWVKTPDGAPSWDIFDKVLGESAVVITPGAGFGNAGEGYFRISAFNSRENAEAVAKRIQAIDW